MIKLAKENLNDPNIIPNLDQINARETLIKLIITSNFLSFKLFNNISNSSDYLNLNTSPDSFFTDKKLSQSQTLLSGVITQMNYNDMKKQKIQIKNSQIWQIIIENNVKNSYKVDKHIAYVCKKYKLKI